MALQFLHVTNVILRELVRRGGKNLRKKTRDPSPRSSSQDDIRRFVDRHINFAALGAKLPRKALLTGKVAKKRLNALNCRNCLLS